MNARHLCALWGQDSGSRRLEAVADWAVLVDDEIRALGVDHPLTVAGQTVLAAQRADWEASLDEFQYVAENLYQDMETEESGGDAAKQRSQDEALLERVIVIKKKIATRSREFDDDSLPVLSARYDLAYALWDGHQYTAAADFTQPLLDDCLRILGEQHELTASVHHLQAAGRRAGGERNRSGHHR